MSLTRHPAPGNLSEWAVDALYFATATGGIWLWLAAAKLLFGVGE